MAASSTGSHRPSPQHVPGSWTHSPDDAELHAEGRFKSEPRPRPQQQQQQQEKPNSAGNGTRRRTHWPPRTCRICLDTVLPTFHTDEGSLPLPESMRPVPRVTYESPPGDGGRLIRPCRCKGSQKYVHEECLGAWRRQDPLQKRNYWQCPTCGYKYQLQRLAWGSWISSSVAQIALTLAIFFLAMFVLGFVADPIINLYLDPVSTIATAGGPTGSVIYEDAPATWTEHFIKGLASLGLLGFAKFLLTLSPWHWFNMRGSGVIVGGRSGVGGTGRDRLQGLSWVAIAVGITTFLWAVWKGVRAWSRRMLEQAGEKVMDVPADVGDDEDDDD